MLTIANGAFADFQRIQTLNLVADEVLSSKNKQYLLLLGTGYAYDSASPSVADHKSITYLRRDVNHVDQPMTGNGDDNGP